MTWQREYFKGWVANVGGDLTIDDDDRTWPFVVADAEWVEDQDGNRMLSTGCAGCVIEGNWVLTSGHCGFKVNGLVQLGLQSQPNLCGVASAQSDFIDGRHLRFVRLDRDALPSVDFVKAPPDAGQVVTGAWHVGWGKFFKNCGERVSVPPTGASFKLGVTVQVSSDGRTLAIVDEDKALCDDDSGGPLLIKEDGDWRLLGIAQRGSCNCGSGQRGVFDFVAPISKEIKDYLASV